MLGCSPQDTPAGFPAMDLNIHLTEKDIKKLLPIAEYLRFKKGYENFVRGIFEADKLIKDKRLKRNEQEGSLFKH